MAFFRSRDPSFARGEMSGQKPGRLCVDQSVQPARSDQRHANLGRDLALESRKSLLLRRGVSQRLPTRRPRLLKIGGREWRSAVALATVSWQAHLTDGRDPAPDFYREGLIDLLVIVRGFDREQLEGWPIAQLEDQVIEWNDEQGDVSDILEGLDLTLAVA